MPKITVTTNDGVVAEQIDISGYDLDKPLARAALWDELTDAVDLAERMENPPADGKA